MTIGFTTRLCLLMQQDQAVERSIREAMKAAFITVRHSNNRTQFQTLDEKYFLICEYISKQPLPYIEAKKDPFLNTISTRLEL